MQRRNRKANGGGDEMDENERKSEMGNMPWLVQRALIKRDTLDDVTTVNRHGMYAY
jgi:hypothetical protein